MPRDAAPFTKSAFALAITSCFFLLIALMIVYAARSGMPPR